MLPDLVELLLDLVEILLEPRKTLLGPSALATFCEVLVDFFNISSENSIRSSRISTRAHDT